MATPPPTPTGSRLISGECSSITSPHDSLAWGQSRTGANGSKGYFLQFEAPKAVLSARRKRSKSAGTRLSADARRTAEAASEGPSTANGTLGSPCLTRGDRELIAPVAGSIAQPDRVPNRAQSRHTDASASVKRRKESDDNSLRQQKTEQYNVQSHGSGRSASDGKVAAQHQRHQDQKQTSRRSTATSQVTAKSLAGLAIGSRSAAARKPSKESPMPGPARGSAKGRRNVEQLASNASTAGHSDERRIVAEVQTVPGSCCDSNEIADDGLMPTDWDELADECSALAREMLDTRDSVTPTSSDGDSSGGGSGDSLVDFAATTAATDSGRRHWWPPEDRVEEQQVISVTAAAVTRETSSPGLPEHRELSTSWPSFDGNDACWRASVCSELRGDILSNVEHAGQPAAGSLAVSFGDSLEEKRLQPAGEFPADYTEARAYVESGDHSCPNAQEGPPAALQKLEQQTQQLPTQQLCNAICTPDVHCIVETSELFQMASTCRTPTLTPVCCDQQLENDASMTASDCPGHAQSIGNLRREPANVASADRISPPTVTRCSPMQLERGAVAELIEQPLISHSVQSVDENAAAAASCTPAAVCHSSSLCAHAQAPARTRSFLPVQTAVLEAVDVDEPASCICTIEQREYQFGESSTTPLRDEALPEADAEDVLNVTEDGRAALGTAMCPPEELDRLSTDGGSVSRHTVVAGGCLKREEATAITTGAAGLLQSDAGLLQSDAGSSTSSCETDSQDAVEATVMQSNEYIKHAESDRLQFVPASPRLSRRRKGRPSNVSRRIRIQEQRKSKTVEALLTAEAAATAAAETAVAGVVAGSQGSVRNSQSCEESPAVTVLSNAIVAVTNTPELVPESVTLVAYGLGDRPDSSAVTSSAQATRETAALHVRLEAEGEGLVEIDPNAFGGQSDDGCTQMPFLIHDNKKNNEPQGDSADRANGRNDRTSSYQATASASVAAEGVGGLNGRMAAAKWISLLKEDLANDEWHSSSDSAPEDAQDGMSSKSLTQRTNFGCDARRGNEAGSSFDDEDWEEEQAFGETENQARSEAQTTAAAKLAPDDEDAAEISGSASHRKHTATAARIRAHAEERRQVQMRGSSSSSDEEHDGSGSSSVQTPAARPSFGHPTAGPIAASRRHAADFSADTGSVGCSQAKRPCNSTSIAADEHLSAERLTLPDVPGNIRPYQPDSRRPYDEAMSDSESSSVSLSSDPAADRLVAQRPGSIALKSADEGTDRTLQPAVADSSLSSSSLVPHELPAGNRLQYEQLPEALLQQQQQSRPLRGILKNSGARPVDRLREQSASHCDLSVLELLRSTAPLSSGSLSHAKSTPAMFDTTAHSADQLVDVAQISDSDKQPADASKAQQKKGNVSSSSGNSAKELLQERLQGSIRDWRNMTAQSVEGKIFEWESTGDFRVHIKQSAPARKETNELGQILRRFASKAESSGQQPAGEEPSKTSLVRSKSVPEVSAAQQQQQQQQQHSSKREVTSSATSLVLNPALTPNKLNDAPEERLQASEMKEHEEDARRTVKLEITSASVGSRAAERASTTFRVQKANGSAEPSSTGVYHARTFSSDWSDCGLDETPLYPQAEEQEVDLEDAFDEAPKHGQRPVEHLERLQLETSRTEEALQDDDSLPQQQRQHDELDQRVALALELHREVEQSEQQWISDDRSQRKLVQSEDEQRPHERTLPEESLERTAGQLLLGNAKQQQFWEQDTQHQQRHLSEQEQQQLWDDEQWHLQEQLRLQEQEQTHLQEQEQLQRQEQAKQEQLWAHEQQQLWEQEQQRLWEQEQQRLWEQEQQRLWEQEQQQLWEQEQQRLFEQEQARQQELLQEQQQQYELRLFQGQEKLLEQAQQQLYLQEQDRQLQDKWEQEQLWAQTSQQQHELEVKLSRQDKQQHFWTDEQPAREQRQDQQQQQWEDEQQQQQEDHWVQEQQRQENDEQKDQQEQRQWNDEQQQDQQRQWEDEEQQDQEEQEQCEDEQRQDLVEQKQVQQDQREQERRRPSILAELAKPLEAHVPQVLPTEQRDRQKSQGAIDILESVSKSCVSYEEEYDSGSSDSDLIQPGVVRSLVSDGLLDAKVAEEMQPEDRRGYRPDFQTKQQGVDRSPGVNGRRLIETHQQQVAATMTTDLGAAGTSTDLRTADSGSPNEEHCMIGESLPDETCDMYRDGLNISKSSQSAGEDKEQILDESRTDVRPSGLRKWPTGVNLVSPDEAPFGVGELHSSPPYSAMQEGNRLSTSTDRLNSETPADSDILASSAGKITEYISVTAVHSHPDTTGGNSSIRFSDSSKVNRTVSDMLSDIGNVLSSNDGGIGMTSGYTGFPAHNLGFVVSDSPSTKAGSACQTQLASERPEARDLTHSTLKLPIPATRHSLRRSREQPGESGEAAASESVTVEATATLESTVPHWSQQLLLNDDEHSVVNSGAFSVEKAAASTSAENLPTADHYGTDVPLRRRDYGIGAATDIAEPRDADEAATRCVSPSEPRKSAAERTSVAFMQATSPEATVFADAFKFAASGTASPVLRDWQATEVAANESLLKASKAAAPADRYRSVSPSVLLANVSPTGSNDFLLQGSATLLEPQNASTASSKTTGLTSETALAVRVQTGGTKYKVAEFVSQIEANSGKHEEAPGKSSLKSHRITSAKSVETTGVHLESAVQPPAGSLRVPSGKEPAAVAADVASVSNDAANFSTATSPFFDRREAEWYGQVDVEEHAGSSRRSASVEELHRMTATDAGHDRTSLAISRATVKNSSKPTLKQAVDAMQSNKDGSRTTADIGSMPVPPSYGKRSSSYDTAIDSKEPLDRQHKEQYAGILSEKTLVSTHMTSTAPISRSSDTVQSKVVEAMSFSSQSSDDRKTLGLLAQDSKYQPAPGKPSESGQLVSSARGRLRMDASKMQSRVDTSATLDISSNIAAAVPSSAQSMPIDSLVNRVLRVRPQDGFASSSTSLKDSETVVPNRSTRADGSVFVSTGANDLAMHTNRSVRLAVPTDVDRRVDAEVRQDGSEGDSGRATRIAESGSRLVGADADVAGSSASLNSNGSSVVGADAKSSWTTVSTAAGTTSMTEVFSHDQQSHLVEATTTAAPTFAKLETKDTDPDRFYQHREQRRKMLLQRRRDFVLTCDTIEETHHDDNASVSSADTDELIQARSVAVRQPSSSAYTDSDEEQVAILRETETIQPEPQGRVNSLVTSSSITSLLSARPFVRMSSPAITTFGVKASAESRTPVRVPDREQDDALRTLPAADGKVLAGGGSSSCQVYFARPAIVRTDDREERSSQPGDFDQLRVGSKEQPAVESVVTKQASASSLQASTQLKEVNATRLTGSTQQSWAVGAVSALPLQTAKSSQQHSKKTDSRKDETAADAYTASIARDESNATLVTARAAPAEPLYRATVKRAEASPTSADYDYARVYKVPPMPKPSVASISSPTSDSYDFHFARPFTNPAPAQRVPTSSAAAAADRLMQSKEANNEGSGARADLTSQYLKDAARMNVLTAISNRSSMNFTHNSNTGFDSATSVEQGSKMLDGNSERGDGRIFPGHPAPVDSPVTRSTAGSTWAQQSGSPSYSLPAPYHPVHVQQSVRNQNQTSGSIFGATSANANFSSVGSASGNNKESDSPRPTAPLVAVTKTAAEPVARNSRSAEVKQKVGSGESTVRTLPPWERSKSLDRSTASRNRREQDRKNDRESASATRSHNAFPQQQQQQQATAAVTAAYKPLSSHDDNAYVELRYASSFGPRTAQHTVSSRATPNRSGNAPKPPDTSAKPFAVTIPRGSSGSAEYSDRVNSRAPETVAHVTTNALAGHAQQRPVVRPSHPLTEFGGASRPAASYRAVPSFETASSMPARAMAMPEHRAAFASRDASSHTEQQTTAGRQAAASSRYETTAEFDHLDPLAASAQQSLKRRPRASDEIAELEEMYARLEVAVDDLTRRQYMLESIDVVDVCLGRQNDIAAQPHGGGRTQRHDRERIEQPVYPTPSVPSSAVDKSTTPEQLLSGRAPQRDQQRVAAHGQYASAAVSSGVHRSAPTEGRRDNRLPVYPQITEPAFSQPPVARRTMANPEAGGSPSQLANAVPEYSPLRSLPQQYRQTHGRQQPEPQAYSRAEPARTELASTTRPVSLEQVPPPRIGYVHPGPWMAAPMPAGSAASSTLAQSGARPDARTGIAPPTEQTVPVKPAKGAAMLAELYAVRDRPNGPSGPAERGYSYQSLSRYPAESPARVTAAVQANTRQEQAPPLSHGNAAPMNPLWIRTDSNAEVSASRDRPPLPASAFQANPFRSDRFSEHTDSRRIQAGGPSSSAQLLMPVAAAPPREIWL